jgi:hypothetical protein
LTLAVLQLAGETVVLVALCLMPLRLAPLEVDLHMIGLEAVVAVVDVAVAAM